MRRQHQLAVLLALAAWAAPLWAQESHLTRSGNGWLETVNGTLPSLRNLKVVTEFGAVTVRGGSPQGITYTVRKRLSSGSESNARRQFELFSVRAYQKADFAILEGACSGSEKISLDITVNVPRELVLTKVETRGGSVEVANIAGRVEAETAGGGMHISDIGGAVQAQGALDPVQHRGQQVQALDALGGPVGGDLLAAHAPHLFGVGLEKDLEQPLAEPVANPVMEVARCRDRESLSKRIGKHAGGAGENPEIAQRLECAQRIRIELSSIIDAR